MCQNLELTVSFFYEGVRHETSCDFCQLADMEDVKMECAESLLIQRMREHLGDADPDQVEWIEIDYATVPDEFASEKMIFQYAQSIQRAA